MQYVKFGNTGMDVSLICLDEIAAIESPYVPHIKTGAF